MGRSKGNQSGNSGSRGVPLSCAVSFAVWVCLACTLGCEDAATRNAPIRSPGLDFRSQSPMTSDGRVVGADNKPIEDRLDEQSNTGWAVDKNGAPTYDKARRVGGHVDTKGSREETESPKAR